MKKLMIGFVAVFVSIQGAFAAPAAQDVMQSLIAVDRVTLDGQGEVLQTGPSSSTHTTILVGIPVKVHVPNVCTPVVGQEIKQNVQTRAGRFDQITVKASHNPLMHACIAIAAEPIEKMLTLPIRVNTQTPGIYANKSVIIGGSFFQVQVNLQNESVSIRPIDISRF